MSEGDECSRKRKAETAELADNEDSSKRVKINEELPETEDKFAPQPTQSFRPTEEFEFDHELELQEYIEDQVRNWYSLSRGPIDQNTWKRIIVISAQLPGSGAAWFGANILSAAKKYKQKLLPLLKDYHGNFEKHFEEFLNSKYIYINMKAVGEFNQETFATSFYHILQEQCPEIQPTPEEKRGLLSPYVMTREVAQWFRNKLGRPLLLHFDEVHHVAGLKESDGYPYHKLQVEENSWYAMSSFWRAIYGLHSSGSIYCSGAPPVKFVLGELAFHLYSNGVQNHFLFDRLLCENIIQLVEKQLASNKLKVRQEVDIAQFSSFIELITAGVPILVKYVMNYLQTCGEITNDLLNRDSFVFLIYKEVYSQRGGATELTGWTDLEEDLLKLYIHFVHESFYSGVTPYKLLSDKKVVTPKGETSINIMQLFSALGIHTAKTPQFKEATKWPDYETPICIHPWDKEIYAIIPPLTAFAWTIDGFRMKIKQQSAKKIFIAMTDAMNEKGFYSSMENYWKKMNEFVSSSEWMKNKEKEFKAQNNTTQQD